MIRGVAARQAAVDGGDAEARLQDAIKAALDSVRPHIERLAARAVEKGIRRQLLCSLPRLDDIKAKKPVAVSIDTSSVVDREVAALTAAADNLDWGYVVSRCPVRETPALDTIARTIGLRERHQHESAVLRLLKDDPACLTATRGLFGDLAERTNAATS